MPSAYRVGIDLGGCKPGILPFLAVFGICFLFWSCATGPQVKVVAEVADPKEARSRSVAVVPDLFMNDAAEADKVAGLVRDQLVSRGFTVKETENEAELVVIPTVERSAPAGAAAAPPARMRRPFDVSYGFGQSNLMESQNALRNLGFEFGTLPAQEQPRVGLIVTAVSREEWFRAMLETQGEIPRVWRIVAICPLEKQDLTPKLVEAVGAKLSEITATSIPAAQPTPTPSIRRKKS
ncbi:MAG TPA: hypothetical protein VIS99_04655 [Terrimicrobiaceae bacterium]